MKKKLNHPDFKAIKNFPSDAQDLIESLQPYNTNPQAHTLSILHALWNQDKHRSPDLMGGASRGVSVNGFNLQGPGGLSAGLNFQEGRIFGYGVIPEGGIAPDAKIELNDIELVFHENSPAKGYIARLFLYDILQLVNEIITKFDPMFPKKTDLVHKGTITVRHYTA